VFCAGETKDFVNLMEVSHILRRSLAPVLKKLVLVPLLLISLYLILMLWVFVSNGCNTTAIRAVSDLNRFLFTSHATWLNKMLVILRHVFGRHFARALLVNIRDLSTSIRFTRGRLGNNFRYEYGISKTKIKRLTDTVFDSVSENLIASRDWTFMQLEEGYLNLIFHRYILNTREDKECDICMEEYMKHHFVDFSACNHGVCVSCFRKYLNTKVYDGECEFLCPFGNEECATLGQKDIRRALKNDTVFSRKLEQAYVRHGLKDLQGDYYECPTEECSNVMFCEHPLVEDHFILDKSGPKKVFKKKLNTDCDLRSFSCSECNYSYCLLCKRSWTFGDLYHDGIDCESYRKERRKSRRLDELLRTQAAVERGIKQNRLRRCPKCNSVIEKNGGCPHMVCSSCRTNFCWKCAKVWGTPPGCYGGCPDALAMVNNNA